jgi:hypothetical protein
VDFLKDGSRPWSGSKIVSINIEQQSQYNSFDNIFSNVDGRTLFPWLVSFEVSRHEGCLKKLLEPIGKRRFQYRRIRGGVYLLNVTLLELVVLFPPLCVLLLQVFREVVCAKFRSYPLLMVGSVFFVASSYCRHHQPLHWSCQHCGPISLLFDFSSVAPSHASILSSRPNAMQKRHEMVSTLEVIAFCATTFRPYSSAYKSFHS